MRMAASTTAMPRGLARGEFGNQFLLAAHHRRMHQGIEPGQPARRSEHQGAEPLAIDKAPSFKISRRIPASRRHRLPRGRQHLMAEFVGLDDQAAATRQYFAHEGLAAGEAAREPTFNMRRPCAPPMPPCWP